MRIVSSRRILCVSCTILSILVKVSCLHTLIVLVSMTQVTREILEDILDKKLEEKLKPICESMVKLKDNLKFLSDEYYSIDKRVRELGAKCQSRAFLLSQVKIPTSL